MSASSPWASAQPSAPRALDLPETWPAVVLIMCWFSFSAWVRPLMLPDEGRYVGVAWEMLRSGDWLVPRINGLPFFHKPPLFYWITAASLELFGPNALSARLASLLGATSSVAALLWVSRRWASAPQAQSTAWVLMTMPLFFMGSQFANLDMLVAGCITVTIVALAHASLCMAQQQPAQRALLVAWLAAALGVLAKGLIGAVLPALVVALWLLASGRHRIIWRLLWWPGLLLFALVAAPWFLAMQLRFPSFLDYFFVVQHFKRFSQGGFNNVQPFWFYPVVLLALTLPWSVWAWPAFRQTLAHLGNKSGAARVDAQPLRALMLCWLVVVVMFFSLPQSKLIGYVLPAVPPLAWLLAESLERGGGRWSRGSGALGLAISLAAVIGLGWTGHHSARPIGVALRHAEATGTPVIFLGTYLYDTPYYARSRAAMTIVDDWRSPDVTAHDNWRKELADAAVFAPTVARQRLLTADQLTARLCAEPATWLVAPLSDQSHWPVLAGLPVKTQADGAGLWHLDRHEAIATCRLKCPGRPNGG